MAIFAMQRERDLAMKGSVMLFLRAPREWRRMLLVGIATATFAQACGIEAAVIYAPQILSGVQPGEEPNNNDVCVLCSLICSWLHNFVMITSTPSASSIITLIAVWPSSPLLPPPPGHRHNYRVTIEIIMILINALMCHFFPVISSPLSSGWSRQRLSPFRCLLLINEVVDGPCC